MPVQSTSVLSFDSSSTKTAATYVQRLHSHCQMAVQSVQKGCNSIPQQPYTLIPRIQNPEPYGLRWPCGSLSGVQLNQQAEMGSSAEVQVGQGPLNPKPKKGPLNPQPLNPKPLSP